ncbi:MAG: DNA repair protein RecO [Candidatus Pacebacteria bacterium CG_4_10_14_0_8_um_filter_43_12]|nr:MAG: DNA repair protein RecO [Candidatus Pacebacteria bacterium CG10_big_fil_rev_8_21_14_0_10_44_11]PIY79704.1 MAG: DNA repair protein RecO [Candidatus Pacebacteria bacterium CG_4_10_14_0_8_um_filter_43_12]
MVERSFICQAVVLKRTSIGETDRVVTLLSQEYGKFAAVAKGVRKLSSTKRALIEPGNIIKAYCVKTKSWPLLTQASLVDDTAHARESLSQIKQLHQLLEILDQLFVELELDRELFNLILTTRSLILDQRSSISFIRQHLEQIIASLGYQSATQAGFENLTDYITSLTNRKIHSFEYLTPKA